MQVKPDKLAVLMNYVEALNVLFHPQIDCAEDQFGIWSYRHMQARCYTLQVRYAKCWDGDD